MSTTSSTSISKEENGSDNGGGGTFNPSPRSEWELISQGAEARVWKLQLLQQQKDDEEGDPSAPSNDDDDDGKDDDNTISNEPTTIICKERFSKAYRHPDLDAKLTKSRCRSEARILERCCAQKSEDDKVRVPRVLRVSPPSLYLEYLDGPNVKAYLQDAAAEANQVSSSGAAVDQDGDVTMKSTIDYLKLAKNIGRIVGSLHSIGIVHGDLTTSNMILLQENNHRHHQQRQQQRQQQNDEYELTIIDFGLAKSTFSVEEQAVDLYVLERALQSTHPELPSSFLDEVLDSYSTIVSKAATSTKGKNTQTALQRLEQVRLRGRKRECFG
jgi:TP53 regulating kinase-like protein